MFFQSFKHWFPQLNCVILCLLFFPQQVIHTHFWLKRNEICAQIEDWIAELSKPLLNERTGRTISFNAMVLRRQYRQLREEFAKLKPPEGLDERDYPFITGITPTTPSVPVCAGVEGSNNGAVDSSATTSPEKPLTSDDDESELLLQSSQGDIVMGEDEDDDDANVVDEVIIKADVEDVAAGSSSSSNDKGTSIPDDGQEENPDLSPEEIVLSMVW